MLAVLGSVALMLIVLCVPVLREIFDIAILQKSNILYLILLIFAPLVIVEIFKLFKINDLKNKE